jgi:probable addiction module antidote protein
LQIALEEYQKDNNGEALLLALRYVAEAQGGLGLLSRKTHLNRASLYKTLSNRGNPKLQTLGLLLKGLGFRLTIVFKINIWKIKRRLKAPNVVKGEPKTRYLARLNASFLGHLCLVMCFYTRFIFQIFILSTI